MPAFGDVVKYRLSDDDVIDLTNLVKATIRGPEQPEWTTIINSLPAAGTQVPLLVTTGGASVISGVALLPFDATPTIYRASRSAGFTNGTWQVL